jgi:hypothetical protein
MPTTEEGGPARRLINIQCSGGVLVDLGASQNTMVIGCQGNGITYAGGLQPVRTKKALVAANRFSTLGDGIEILGEDNVFVGNVCAGGLTFGTGCKNSSASGNVLVTTYTDSSGSTGTDANTFDVLIPRTSYVCSWTGASSNPAIGDGTLVSTYSRYGNQVQVDVALTIGSTTTLGSGVWSFSLPIAVAAGSGHVVGAARIGQTNYGAATVLGTVGTSTVLVYAEGASTAVSGTVPAAWSTGHTLIFSLSYTAV